jgi:predicted NBD/HSP70 family sugar kinase
MWRAGTPIQCRFSMLPSGVARAVLLQTIELLSTWLGNVIDLLEPDVVVIGGGVASTLRPFFVEMQAGLSRFCVNSRGCEISLLPASYGEDTRVAGGGSALFPSEPGSASFLIARSKGT